MKNRIKYTTVALDDNQYLIPTHQSSIVETYCIGYSDGRRDRKLDGYYFTKELTMKPKLQDFSKEEYNKRIESFIK